MAIFTILRPPLLVPNWSDSGPLDPTDRSGVSGGQPAAGRPRPAHRRRPRRKSVSGHPLFDDKVMAIGLRSEEIVERIEPDTDLIGVSCMFSQDWPEIRRLIQMVAAPLPRHPDCRRRRAHHRDRRRSRSTPPPKLTSASSAKAKKRSSSSRQRSIAALRTTTFPAWCCAPDEPAGLRLPMHGDADHALDRIARAHPEPRRHSVAGMGSRAARPLSRQRPGLRR